MPIISFDNFTTKSLASCEPKRKIRRGGLSEIVKIADIHPVCSTESTDIIKQKFEELLNKPFVMRMMTITLDSYMNPMIDESIPYQIQQLELCFNFLKKLGTEFIACLEYHKSRVVYHAHVLYKSKNMNRIRIQKRAIRKVVSKRNSYSCLKDEVVNNIPAAMNYLIKHDVNSNGGKKKYYFLLSKSVALKKSIVNYRCPAKKVMVIDQGEDVSEREGNQSSPKLSV